MGLDTSSVMFLCAARSLGVDFSSTAMIGRQAFFPDVAALRRVFAVLGIDRDAHGFAREHQYGEPFLSLLGANEIASVDASPYENASIIHDMNLPIPESLRERFSAVHDGGTIEHVFNIPQAFKNCMEMVRVGGHFTQVNVANNYMGHGFWQFSPELIFRIFSPANGFRLEAVLLHEVIPGGAWHLVADPDVTRSRVELCNDRPTYILTIAQRVARTEIFSRPPQQSDYVALWDRALGPHQAPVMEGGAQPTCWQPQPSKPVKRSLRSVVRRLAGRDGSGRGFDAACYRRIEEDDVLRGKLITPG